MNSEKPHTPVAGSYLYHRVPENLADDTLFPLNQLAHIHPTVFVQEAEKYVGREHLREVRIPIFNCLWNDVLHLTPLHPTKTKQALLSTGNLLSANRQLRFFVIPPDTLQSDKLLLFKNSLDVGKKYDFSPDDFERFEIALYEELDEVPIRQIRYFEDMAAAGERPLLWKRTPHVFYRGSIPVKDLETIEW